MTLSEDQRTEIQIARSQTSQTLRPTSPGAEAVMHTPYEVLDHGFVRLVDYMGDDSSVPQAARVSYGTGTRKTSSDAGLIRYLMRHRHTTPFEMITGKFHVKLPVFVARQWMRHRTSTYNEYSARYSVLDREFYLPEPDVLAAQSQTNKQGRGDILDEDQSDRVLEILRTDAARAYDHYEEMIDPETSNLARELARINLPTNIYTQFYWSVNLHNLFHFLGLRQDSHAQYEIRVYADALNAITRDWCPVSHGAFEDFRRGGKSLSRQAAAFINAALQAGPSGHIPDPADFGLEGRELRETLGDFPALSDLLGE